MAKRKSISKRIVLGLLAAVAVSAGQTPAAVRAEVLEVPGGEAEVVTYFQQIPDGAQVLEMPVLAVLRDTFGDGDASNDRLRQVWVFTYRHPSIWRRVLGAVPFLYRRAPVPDGDAAKPAPAVLDLGEPSRGLWKGLAGSAVQVQVLDPFDWTVRLASRSYGSNVGEYRRMHVWQALDVLHAFAPQNQAGLSTDELRAIQGRLELSGQLFGGLVSDEYLDEAFAKSRTRRMQTRQGNWDLLRQRAEENGLYFQPVALAGLPTAWAILWAAETELTEARPFEKKFLGIESPFGDARLRNWTGPSESWWLDGHGSVVKSDTPGARPTRMIPLALYSLDHPRSPLLVADLRRAGAPRRAEMFKRLSGDIATGVLGWTGFNWSFLAAKSAYGFVRSRHGSPLDRSARLRAYVQVQHALASDRSLAPDLREELARRVGALNVNPMERDWRREVESARRQYAGFLRFAYAPDGLSQLVGRNRADESYRMTNGPWKRSALGAVRLATLGLYRPRPGSDEAAQSALPGKRRELWLKRQAVALPPAPVPAALATPSTVLNESEFPVAP